MEVGTYEELSNLVVENNKDMKKLLQTNARSKIIVLLVDRKYEFADIKVKPDVRSLQNERTGIYAGMEFSCLTDHYHVDLRFAWQAVTHHVDHCSAWQAFGHRQDTDYCP